MKVNFDYAQLSPSMSRQRFSNNFMVAITDLAKKQMAINEDMLSQLLDTPQMSADSSQNFDVKI